MRKANMILSIIVTLWLFTEHSISMSIFYLSGLPTDQAIPVTAVQCMLLLAHIVLSVMLSVPAFAALKKSGAAHFADNKSFWIKRITGVIVVLLAVLHITTGILDMQSNIWLFACRIMLYFSLYLHVLFGTSSVLIKLGTHNRKAWKIVLYIIFSGVFLFACVAATAVFARRVM